MAMSSLVPGVLFKSTGLNTSHTPTEITAKPVEIKAKYRRSSIPEKTWPPDSPVARVYDVRNSSSRLILLNNKMEQKSHLRVQSGRYRSSPSSSENESASKPERRDRAVSARNESRHVNCLDSTTPCFGPTTLPPDAHRTVRSRADRCPQVSEGGYQVSDWHHYSSRVDSRPGRAQTAPPRRNTASPRSKGRQGEITPPPSFRRDTSWLQHPDMTKGQKLYVNSIAKVYDMTNMKQLKQAQYIQLIYREQQRGFFTPENYRKYLIYLNSDRIRQFGVCAPPSALTPTSKTPRTPKSARKQDRAERAPKRTEHQKTPRDASQEPERVSDGEEDQQAVQTRQDNSDRLSTGEGDGSFSSDSGDDRKPYPQPSADKRTTRPKSSKYRQRESGRHKAQRSASPSPESSSEEESGGRSPKQERYWRQPSPPEREREPDGRGLVMTSTSTHTPSGETLEVKDTSDERAPAEGKTSASKSHRKTVDKSSEPTTYDLEEDGHKTRVYNRSEMDAPPRDDSPVDNTPLITSNQESEPSRESPPPGRKELASELANKQRALESDSD